MLQTLVLDDFILSQRQIFCSAQSGSSNGKLKASHNECPQGVRNSLCLWMQCPRYPPAFPIKGQKGCCISRRNVSRKDLLSGMSTAVQTKYIALEKTSIVVTNVIRGRSRNRPGSLLYKEASRDAAWPVLSPSAGVFFCPMVALFILLCHFCPSAAEGLRRHPQLIYKNLPTPHLRTASSPLQAV